MSAFVVDVEHIDALISAALVLSRPYSPFRWYPKLNGEQKTHDLASFQLPDSDTEAPDFDPRTEVGKMLIAENRRSVGYRYPGDRALPGPNDTSRLDGYKFRELPGYPDPVTVLKAVHCYEYQSCETDDWEETEAAAFCRSLKETATRKLQGYDEADSWSITRRDIFANPKGIYRAGESR